MFYGDVENRKLFAQTSHSASDNSLMIIPRNTTISPHTGTIFSVSSSAASNAATDYRRKYIARNVDTETLGNIFARCFA